MADSKLSPRPEELSERASFCVVSRPFGSYANAPPIMYSYIERQDGVFTSRTRGSSWRYADLDRTYTASPVDVEPYAPIECTVLFYCKWAFDPESGSILMTDSWGKWVPFEGITSARLNEDGLVVVDPEEQEHLDRLIQPWIMQMVTPSGGSFKPHFMPVDDQVLADVQSSGIKFWSCFGPCKDAKDTGWYYYTPIVHFGDDETIVDENKDKDKDKDEDEGPSKRQIIYDAIKVKDPHPLETPEWSWPWMSECPLLGYSSIDSDSDSDE